MQSIDTVQTTARNYNAPPEEAEASGGELVVIQANLKTLNMTDRARLDVKGLASEMILYPDQLGATTGPNTAARK